jgi:hypothetical protein
MGCFKPQHHRDGLELGVHRQRRSAKRARARLHAHVRFALRLLVVDRVQADEGCPRRDARGATDWLRRVGRGSALPGPGCVVPGADQINTNLHVAS